MVHVRGHNMVHMSLTSLDNSQKISLFIQLSTTKPSFTFTMKITLGVCYYAL